jgi:ADP-ribosylglycohydrolase
VRPDYEERVYAGVLGKLIGVYLGRPVEGWSHERIVATIGEVDYYIHERPDVDAINRLLVVADDDITGTFVFLRALADSANSRDLSAGQIGETWLNYIVERRTVLWWGGIGNSTEHTAYLRLKHGIDVPASGSQELNGKVVAEQIGAQIFVDGWAMVAPGDPALASELARRAGSVSHDGEALHAAQLLAAMEAQAFVESDTDRLLDVALELIPRDSLIARMVDEIRAWCAQDEDWRATRRRIEDRYGYRTYGGNCHVVPNHALVICALLHGGGDFQRSMMIVNTSGWDTDSNAGNLGCLLGIKNGLAGIDAGPDWRGPVADRLYLPTADGGAAITDAVTESFKIVNSARGLQGAPALAPKAGSRFHFELPGAVQGFRVEDARAAGAIASLENVAGHSRTGSRSLAVRFQRLAPGRLARIATPTFIPPEAIATDKYGLLASPTLYPGQLVRAELTAGDGNAAAIRCALFARCYDGEDRLVRASGPHSSIEPGSACALEWRVQDTGGQPIAEIGVEIASDSPDAGVAYLDCLSWSGVPDLDLTRPLAGGTMWERAWVNALDRLETSWPEPFRLIQEEGLGLLIQGARDWTDYECSAELTPHMALATGIAVRVQGMRRYYALLLAPGGAVRLVKAREGTIVLAARDFAWRFGCRYELKLRVRGTRLQASIDGAELFDLDDQGPPLSGGGVALLCEEGRVASGAVKVRSLPPG